MARGANLLEHGVTLVDGRSGVLRRSNAHEPQQEPCGGDPNSLRHVH
jgi:hypothetical protein